MNKFKLLATLLLLIVTTSIRAEDSLFVKVNNWQELLDKAKKEKKMIFIDCYFVDCGPCKDMEDEVFPMPAVSRLMRENFINVKFDCRKEDLGKLILLKYLVLGFPTYVVLNSEGLLVSRFSGYQEADKFQELLRQAIADARQGKTLRGFSSELGLQYPAFYSAYFEKYKSIPKEELEAYLEGKDIFSEVYTMPFLLGQVPNKALEDKFLAEYGRFESDFGKDIVYGKRLAVLGGRLKAAIPERDDAKFEDFLKKTAPLVSRADWPYVRLDLAELYFYKMQNDHNAFFRYAAKYPNDDDNKPRYMAFYLRHPSVPAEEKKLYAAWLEKVIHKNSSFDLLSAATQIMHELKDTERTKRYAAWAIQKARLINKNETYFERFLN